MSYIEGFIRFMSKGAQCRKAACQNAGVRIDQGAVEVQKTGASHDPKIAAKSKRIQVRLVWFLLRVIRYRGDPAASPAMVQKAEPLPLLVSDDAETVRHLCRHQHADVVVPVQLGDLALEHAGSFGANDRIGQAMKLGHEAPALPVQISIRDRHVEGSLSSLAAAGPDLDVGISACSAIAVHDHPFANHGERRIEG